MGKSVYRRGAPILGVGGIATVLVIGWLAGTSALAKHVAPPPKTSDTTTSDFKDLPIDPSSPPPLEPLAGPTEPKAIRIPVVTEPAGAVVYEVDNGRRRQLCAKTPCEISVWKTRIEQMVVSLELGGFEPARAHVKDAADVPGGSVQMTFTRAYSGPALGVSYGSHPILRQGATTVEGRLPPEVVQRIVRQNFGRFRLCYENALRHNPTLEGRVVVKFVIGRDGSVPTASDGGSDIRDGTMVDCIVKGFPNLSFPQPEGDVVKVTYPIIFKPGESTTAHVGF